MLAAGIPQSRTQNRNGVDTRPEEECCHKWSKAKWNSTVVTASDVGYDVNIAEVERWACDSGHQCN